MNLLKNRIEDFIKVYDNVMSHELCDQIIEEFENDDWENSKIVKDKSVNTEIRNCSTLAMYNQKVNNRNPEYRKRLDIKTFHCMCTALQKYKDNFVTLDVANDTGYNILKYTEGQFFAQHTDSYQNREVTCSLMLNDDYEGGEFAFFDQQIQFKLKKGQAIMFPSNFMRKHEI